MKILLINPPYLSIYGPDKVAVNSHFPLGLGYLAASLLENGFEVKLLDPEAERLSRRQFEEGVVRWGADLIGLTATTPTFLSALNIGRAIRKLLPNTPIVLGGPQATVMPEFILSHYSDIFDYIAVGEGELTLIELCRVLDRGNGTAESVPGLVLMKRGRTHRTKPRAVIEDLDTIPMPARDIGDMRLYYEPNDFNNLGLKSATMLTSRACPHNCIFCASRSIWGNHVRFHSPERVVEEIRLLRETYDVQHILFKDDTFTIHRDRVAEICDRILQEGLDMKFSCLARVDGVDRELLGLMKRAGFYHICYGIETGDARLLKVLRKGITLEQARDAMKITNELGFKSNCTFLIGIPGETRQTALKTIRFAIELNPTLALFYIMVPYPGTALFEKHLKDKFYESPNWEDFVISKGAAMIELETVSREELKRLLALAHRKYYFRPKAVLNILKQIKTFDEFRIYLRGGLGMGMRILNLAFCGLNTGKPRDRSKTTPQII